MELSKPDATPGPERSLNRQLVLEEDEYTAALSKIIARDFFPSLVHLDATNDYLDAVSSRDPHLIQASVRRLQEISDTPLMSSSRRRVYQTPSRTPWGAGPSDTPLRTPLTRGTSEGPPLKRPKYETEMSLDEFQARYTSEDNSSFTQILDEENRQRKDKYGWAWDAQRRVDAQNGKMVEAREKMLIEPPPMTGVRERVRIEVPTPAGHLTDGKEDRETVKGKMKATDEDGYEAEDAKEEGALVLRENGQEPVDVMAPRKDPRGAGVDGWKFKARNSLMFAPDADVRPYDPLPKEPEKDPKVIKYTNTRLPEQDQSGALSRSTSAPPSPTRSRIDAAITGAPYRPKLPNEDGFTLVPNIPSPTPAELGPTAMKQLMTWGTLNATPRVISQSDDLASSITAASPFHLPEMSSREATSRRLSMKAGRSLRAKAEMLGLRTPGISVSKTPLTPGKKGVMAPPTWTPRRADAPGNLTPAARRLLQRSTLGTAGAKRAEAMERNAAWDNANKGKERELNRVRWTPTPSPVAQR